MSRTAVPAARSRWVLRDRPAVFWLVAAAVVAVAHPFIPDSRWLMVHMVALGALSHSIIVWSGHFTRALLKTNEGENDRRLQSARILLLQAGAALVLISVPFLLWPVTVVGAAAVAAAAIWHGVSLWSLLRKALPARFTVTVHYYLVAACFLPIGATFGALLARDLSTTWHGRLLVAHTMANLLGWVTLTAVGTLVTLWPTILRTRMDDDAVRLSRRLLPGLTVAIVAVLLGATTGWRWVAVAGVAAYLIGLVILAKPMVTVARRKVPRTFPALSVAAAYVWLLVALVTLGWTLASSGSWSEIGDSYGLVTVMFIVGFALQLLLGALSHLLPVVLGGGPSVLRAALRWLEAAGVLRTTVVNAGLIVWMLPVSAGMVRVVVSVVILAALASFIPLMILGIRAVIRLKRQKAEGVAVARAVAPAYKPEPDRWPFGELLTGLLVLTVAVTVGVGLSPSGVGGPAPETVTATGQTTTLRVEARDMRFFPAEVTVARGDRLVIELVNTDPSEVHDLVLANGVSSGRLDPGGAVTVDAGVIGSSRDGWCSIVGHRQMGMTFTVHVTGSPETGAASHQDHAGPASGAGAGGPDAADDLDFLREPSPEFQAVDPVLPPLGDERVHRVTMVVREELMEVAPGVTQLRWTFNGQAPGPTLHGRVGDRFEITLVNEGTMGHSIDFHASEIAPDVAMRTIPPGESLTYDFTASRAGVWMYHCSTMPMSAHIAAGMHGAVVIEPEALPPVDRSYLLVQSEVYLGEPDGPVNMDKVVAQAPDAVVFNGVANQYDHRPLTARVGERVRFWVLDAGPNRAVSFHIVGTQFDTVYAEGHYLLREGTDAFGETGGAQTLGLLAAQGGFVETTFVEPGRYPVVNHIMSDAERGAHGFVVAE